MTGPVPRGGFGMTVDLVERLLGTGVDVDHLGQPRLGRPRGGGRPPAPEGAQAAQLPRRRVGQGDATLEAGGETVSVLNLGSPTAAMPEALPPYGSWAGADLEGTVVVDFHGDSAWEKMEFATAVDGRVAAVLGTHTHEPTSNLHVLPGGTALVVDVGMTGPTGSPGGFP